MENNFVLDLEQVTINNDNYRRVIYTYPNKSLQLVVMSIEPGEYIGKEVHHDVNQFIKIEQGEGSLLIGNTNVKQYSIQDGNSAQIPAGTWHDVYNSGTTKLKLYTLYSPAKHKDLLVQKFNPTTYISHKPEENVLTPVVQDNHDTLNLQNLIPFYDKYLKYKNKYLELKNKINMSDWGL